VANCYETSKIKFRTGPVNPYYLRLRPRLSFWQRVRLLFGAQVTAYVEMDSDGAGPYRARCYMDGDTRIPADLDHGDDWEALAPGGLLSPSQADRFCGLLILDAMKRRTREDIEEAHRALVQPWGGPEKCPDCGGQLLHSKTDLGAAGLVRCKECGKVGAVQTGLDERGLPYCPGISWGNDEERSVREIVEEMDHDD